MYCKKDQSAEMEGNHAYDCLCQRDQSVIPESRPCRTCYQSFTQKLEFVPVLKKNRYLYEIESNLAEECSADSFKNWAQPCAIITRVIN